MFSLFVGKSYAIFVNLFGFTFFIQSNNQQRKGKDFGYRFLWRLVLLTFFATLNAAFFPAGDVLLLFAVVGVVLFIARRWSNNAILIASAILFAPLYALKDYAMTLDASIGQTLGVVLDMWQKLMFTLVLISSFVLLYQNKKFSSAFDNFRYYGKMSLTNYVTQSIAGAVIFFPIGLHLATYCGYTFSLFIGIILYFVQMNLCKLWLKHHKQGPLEQLWHKLTWLGNGKN